MNKKILSFLILNVGLISPGKYENIFRNVGSWFSKLGSQETSSSVKADSDLKESRSFSSAVPSENEIIQSVAAVAVINNAIEKKSSSKPLSLDESKIQKMLTLDDSAYNSLKSLPQYKTMFLDFAKGCIDSTNKMNANVNSGSENRSADLISQDLSETKAQVAKLFDDICSNNLRNLAFEPKKLDNKFIVGKVIKSKAGKTADQIKNTLIENLKTNLSDKNTAEFFGEIKNVKNEQEYTKIVQKRFDSQESKINAVNAIAKVFSK